MNKFWKGDLLELYDVPEGIKTERKRVWSPYRDEDTIPIKIIKVYKIKEEYQAEYGKYAYKCKIMHDDVSTYDDITLTEREIFEFSV